MKVKAQDIKQQVEDMGVMFERFGRTPMTGRVFAFLLLSDPPHRSFDEIVEFLGASKSSISTSVNLLLKEGSVTYVTFSGDRKRYFKIDTEGWLNQTINNSKNLTSFNLLLEKVLEQRKGTKSKDFNKDLERVLSFQQFLSKKVNEAITEWES